MILWHPHQQSHHRLGQLLASMVPQFDGGRLRVSAGHEDRRRSSCGRDRLRPVYGSSAGAGAVSGRSND